MCDQKKEKEKKKKLKLANFQKKKNLEFKLFAKIKFVILEGDVKQVIDEVK